MAEAFEEELERLDPKPLIPLDEPDWRARMWRRSYLVALNAIKALEKRVSQLQQNSWDTPMKFFYPSEDEP